MTAVAFTTIHRLLSSLERAAGGRRLLALMRLFWMVMVGGSAMLWLLGMRPRLRELHAVAAATAHELGLPATSGWLAAYPEVTLACEALLMASATIVGLAVVWRLPRSWMALLTSVIVTSFSAYNTGSLRALAAANPMWDVPVRALLAFSLVATLLFFYLFPDGRLPFRWTGIVATCVGIWHASWLLFPALPVNAADPFDAPLWVRVVLAASWTSTGVCQLQRLARERDPRLREQFRLVSVTAFALTGVYNAIVLAGAAAGVVGGTPAVIYDTVQVPVFIASMITFPAVFAYAATHYRLWDIGSFVSRTVTYGLVTISLGVVYGATIVLFSRLPLQVTRESDVAVAASTLLTAAIFRPARARIQTVVDRRFNRARVDAVFIVHRFSLRLRQHLELEGVSDELLSVVHLTLAPDRAVLWLPPAAHVPRPSEGH